MKQLTLFEKVRAALVTFDVVMVLLLLFLYGRTAGVIGVGDMEQKEAAGMAGMTHMEQKSAAGIQGIGYAEQRSTAAAVHENLNAGLDSSESVVADDTLQEKKKVALTFDDGPHYAYTKILLDGLKERGVVATFFVTGEHAALHPDLIKRMQEEGHLVGNHTYSHIALRNNNREEYKEELIRTSEVLEEITGEEVIFVRPPYGSWDKTFEEELNMIPVLWTVDPLDWCSSSAECIVQNTMCEVQENDIILMHDYYETSVTAALEIVDELLEDGFTFVTVEEIMFD